MYLKPLLKYLLVFYYSLKIKLKLYTGETLQGHYTHNVVIVCLAYNSIIS